MLNIQCTQEVEITAKHPLPGNESYAWVPLPKFGNRIEMDGYTSSLKSLIKSFHFTFFRQNLQVVENGSISVLNLHKERKCIIFNNILIIFMKPSSLSPFRFPCRRRRHGRWSVSECGAGFMYILFQPDFSRCLQLCSPCHSNSEWMIDPKSDRGKVTQISGRLVTPAQNIQPATNLESTWLV